MATYKYLVKKNVAYDYGLNVEGQDGVVLPLSSTSISLLDSELTAGSAVLLSEGKIVELIAEKISSVGSIVGTTEVKTRAEIELVIQDFNSGQDIPLVGGTVYNQAIANSGDVLIFRTSDNATEDVYTEEGLVDDTKEMTLLTHNNADVIRIKNLETNDANQDIELAQLRNDLNDKVGGTFGMMDATYAPVNGHDVATYNQINVVDARIDGLIGNSGDGTYDTKTATKVRDDGQDARLTVIEQTISSGIDIEVADAVLSTNYQTLVSGGLPPISGGESTATFNLPSQDDDGLDYNYLDDERMTLWLYDGVATTSRKMLVNSFEETNFHFRELNFNVTAKIDTSTTPNSLVVNKTSGNDNVFDVLKLAFIEQTKAIPLTGIAKDQDLVELENKINTDLNDKQDKQDNSLNTTSQFIAGGINENKEAVDIVSNNTQGIKYDIQTTIDGEIPAIKGDLLVKDFTNLNTLKELYDGHGSLFVANEKIKIRSGAYGATDNEFVYAYVGQKQIDGSFALSGELNSGDGTEAKSVYLRLTALSAPIAIQISDWQETMSVGDKTFVRQEVVPANNASSSNSYEENKNYIFEWSQTLSSIFSMPGQGLSINFYYSTSSTTTYRVQWISSTGFFRNISNLPLTIWKEE